MAHPVEDSEEYLIGSELQYARLLYVLSEMEVIEIDHLVVAAKTMDLEVEVVRSILTRARRSWLQACEGAEADKMLEDIRACVNDGDQSMAEFNFEALDKHMVAGRRPPSDWTKENK